MTEVKKDTASIAEPKNTNTITLIQWTKEHFIVSKLV